MVPEAPFTMPPGHNPDPGWNRWVDRTRSCVSSTSGTIALSPDGCSRSCSAPSSWCWSRWELAWSTPASVATPCPSEPSGRPGLMVARHHPVHRAGKRRPPQPWRQHCLRLAGKSPMEAGARLHRGPVCGCHPGHLAACGRSSESRAPARIDIAGTSMISTSTAMLWEAILHGRIGHAHLRDHLGCPAGGPLLATIRVREPISPGPGRGALRSVERR